MAQSVKFLLLAQIMNPVPGIKPHIKLPVYIYLFVFLFFFQLFLDILTKPHPCGLPCSYEYCGLFFSLQFLVGVDSTVFIQPLILIMLIISTSLFPNARASYGTIIPTDTMAAPPTLLTLLWETATTKFSKMDNLLTTVFLKAIVKRGTIWALLRYPVNCGCLGITSLIWSNVFSNLKLLSLL